MARRKAKRAVARKTRVTRRRRTGRRKARASAASGALASALARIGELEDENRRLRRELAAARGEPDGDLGTDGNDAPLAPGM